MILKPNSISIFIETITYNLNIFFKIGRLGWKV